jgi:hypothetical protein
MTTVYLATAGEYSDYRVKAAFTRREDAEAFPLGDDVLEMELHDGPAEVRQWHELHWNVKSADGRGNPWTYSEPREFDGDEKHAEHFWHNGGLRVGGRDLSLVKKVYSEQRAQYLAGKEGIA